MDTFFEQIIAIKKTAKDYMLLLGLWLVAFLLSAVLFVFSFAKGFAPVALLLVCLVFYGAYRLSQRLFIEYEYIVTNGTLDIDKIIAKSSRKRVASIEISTVGSVEKFSPAKKNNNNAKIFIACNPDDPDAWVLSASDKKGEKTVIALAPNDKIKKGIISSLPKYFANSAFRF